MVALICTLDTFDRPKSLDLAANLFGGESLGGVRLEVSCNCIPKALMIRVEHYTVIQICNHFPNIVCCEGGMAFGMLGLSLSTLGTHFEGRTLSLTCGRYHG